VQHGYQRDAAVSALLERVRGIEEVVRSQPGVVSVGAATQLPVGRYAGLESDFLKSRGIAGGDQYGAGAGLFATLGTPVLAGREFHTEDLRTDAPVAIVNAAAAGALFPNVPLPDVLGRTVAEAGAVRMIVGVIADIIRVPGQPTDPAIAVPVNTAAARHSSSSLMIAARMAPGMALDLRALDAALDARLGPNSFRIDAVLETMTPFLQRPRFQAALFAALAVIALLLAAAGIYAVVSFEVSRRRYEMGIRLSLGATGHHLRRVIIGGALRPVALGVLAGAIGAIWAAKFLQAFLVGVDGRDPWTMILVGPVLVVTAIAASWLPARRAARVDPIATLSAK
jgi:hypothetical protein